MAPQCTQYICPVKKRKHFIRAFIAQALPAVRIDMVHEQGDISLLQCVKGSFFWENMADEFMVLLGGAFLSG